MLELFEEFVKTVTFKPKYRSIDNGVFKLHYKITAWSLFVCCILVSSEQYIGKHIRCIADEGVDIGVIESYCFFMGTYTVVRHLNPSNLDDIPHPGVGPVRKDDEVIHHAYYQWVPFVLFAQGIMFYLPHCLWSRLEGGRLKAIAAALENEALVAETKEVKVNDDVTIMTEAQRKDTFSCVLKSFQCGLPINRSWAFYLFLCELLNAGNVIFQLYLTNLFLGGSFLRLGTDVTQADLNSDTNPLDVVFPKVTKCNFYKYGPSGTIQKHDALCVMALNVVNEKIYMFFWFWLIILGVATAMGLIWRLLTFVLHKRSFTFNYILFYIMCPAPIDKYDIPAIMDSCHFCTWLFLYYLGKSMDRFVFKKLLEGFADQIEPVVSLASKSAAGTSTDC